MHRVNVGHKSLAEYASIVGRSLAEEIRMLAEPLQGRRMLHLSATAFGGGVAEIQYTLIPLLNDVGIDDRVAGDRGPGRVLRRHQDDPQRAAG